MAILAPFKGITYNLKRFHDLSLLVAPPYDVISPEEQDFFYLIHPNNVIRLILGKKKTGDSDWDNPYTRAASYFSRWMEEKILVRAQLPCLYLTSVTYSLSEKPSPVTRWGIIGLVKIEEADSKVILPHERTFSRHKEDRLRLRRACNAQFSQIFGLYSDKEDKIMGLLEDLTKKAPDVEFVFKDNTEHRLWTISNPELIARICDLFLEKQILIADGHHRYETARTYRNIMRTKYFPKPSNRAYEYVMFYLCNMDSGGLTILPTHRLLTFTPIALDQEFFKRLESFFHVTKLPYQEIAKSIQELETSGLSSPSFLMLITTYTYWQ